MGQYRDDFQRYPGGVWVHRETDFWYPESVLETGWKTTGKSPSSVITPPTAGNRIEKQTDYYYLQSHTEALGTDEKDVTEEEPHKRKKESRRPKSGVPLLLKVSLPAIPKKCRRLRL